MRGDSEEDFLQAIYDYAGRKYDLDDIYDRFFGEFPEKDWELPEEAAWKNFFIWAVLEKVMPETGKTIAEEYADNTPELSPETREDINRLRNFIRSKFLVISGRGMEYKVKDMRTSLTYPVISRIRLPSNALIEGRIHPFGVYYRFSGIFRYSVSPFILDPEVMFDYYEESRVKRLENMLLYHSSRLAPILNKYPVHWIDSMARELGVKCRLKKDRIRGIESKLADSMPDVVAKLSEKSKDALRLCLKNGGAVKYGMLKAYDDGMTFFWKENTPKSTIGALRQTGLLAVGKMPIGGRMYKVALVPADLREKINEALADPKQRRL